MEWHTQSAEEVLETVETGESGLDGVEARARLEADGPNEIRTDEGRSPLRVFLAQFSSALIWVLILAAALSAAIDRVVDAALIAVILLANGIFGFVQEYRAERSLEALRSMTTPEATVRRDGEAVTVDVTELVTGDVVLLEGGDVVPADCRLVDVENLEVDEAALTGESLPVTKSEGTLPAETPLAERGNMAYRGTNVTRGSAVAVVVATGMETEMGAIATELLSTEASETPLQRDLDSLGRKIGLGVVVLSAIVVPLLVVGGTAPVQAGLTAVSLAVAAVPEGLPAVVTLTLAVGVRAMAAENALVRRLPAVEGLGSVDVICTDKTGTITEGRMRVRAAWVHDREVDHGPWPEADAQLDRLFQAAAVCNDATTEDGDPTERALVAAAADYGFDIEELRAEYPRVQEVPFSSERRRMATVHEDVVFVKGAPSVLLERSDRILGADGPEPLDDETRGTVEDQVDAFAEDALRVLAVASRDPPAGEEDPESDLVFVGLVGLLDPPREEVAEAIAETYRAGIDVKLITGDNPATARAVAAQVGIESEVRTGSEIAEADDATLERWVDEVDIFARAEPSHKVRILRALQAQGHSVAMTGDGVNDAPALKNADIGIAMGVRGTDVAKQASDMILLDDNYGTIRTAVYRGRTIFDNIWKFVAYLLSANAAEVALVFVASLLGYLILPAVQLLWINLLTDGLPALALGADPGGDVMDRQPREREAGLVDREMLTLIGGAGTVATVLLFGLMLFTLDGAPSVTPYAMTMVFTGFVVFEFVKLYVVRWIRGTPLVSNGWLATAVAASLVLHLAILYTPLRAYFGTVALGLADWALLAGTVLVGAPLLVGVGLLVRRQGKGSPEPPLAGASGQPEAGPGED